MASTNVSPPMSLPVSYQPHFSSSNVSGPPFLLTLFEISSSSVIFTWTKPAHGDQVVHRMIQGIIKIPPEGIIKIPLGRQRFV